MSTAATAAPENPSPAQTPAPQQATGAGPNFFNVLRSETIKFFGLRSTWILLTVTTVVIIGLAATITALYAAFAQPEEIEAAVAFAPEGWTVDFVNIGLRFAIVVLGAMGAVYIASEYATKSILSSMTAVPRRWPVLIAKAIVLLVVSWVLTTISLLISVGIGNLILSGTPASIDLGETPIAMTVFLSGFYAASIAIMGLGLGAMMRNTAGAIVTLIVLILVTPVVLTIIHGLASVDWVLVVADVLPQATYDSLFVFSAGAEHRFDDWANWLIMAAWPAAALIGGLITLKARDV